MIRDLNRDIWKALDLNHIFSACAFLSVWAKMPLDRILCAVEFPRISVNAVAIVNSDKFFKGWCKIYIIDLYSIVQKSNKSYYSVKPDIWFGIV